MAISPPSSAAAASSDETDLARLGYTQGLSRTLGGFSSFAAGFSYISILTGLFQMVPLGYRAAGPAFFWTWPVVVFGQMTVALGFAELSAHYPLCGSVYQWTKRISTPAIGWLAGWVSLAGSIAALATVAMALQAALPAIWPGFQLLGDARNPADSSRNAVLLGVALILVSTLLNARGVTLLTRFNNIGVIAEITGAVALIALLFLKSRNSPAVVFSAEGRAPSPFPVGPGAFLAAGLTASYVLYGFETAGSLAEETVSPRLKSPRAILSALGSAAILGALLLLAGFMAADSPHDPALGRPDGGLAKIALDRLGPVASRVALAIVAVAIASCTLAVQTGAVRLMYAMARDGRFPGWRWLSHVSEGSKTPTGPALVTGAAAILLLIANRDAPQVVEAIGSVSVVWINLAYLFVSVALLARRLRGWPGSDTTYDDCDDYFRLGRWGLPLNVAAVIWGVVIVVNTAWPRAEVYGNGFPGRWMAPLGTVGLLFCGILSYNLAKIVRTAPAAAARREPPRP